MKRQSRDEINKESVDFLMPVDITQFGSADDPCFGKHHDIKAQECQRCGDQELCSIVTSQGLHKKRKEIEAGQPMKDLEEYGMRQGDKKVVRKFMKKKLKKGKKQIEKLSSLICKEFNLTINASRKYVKRLGKGKKFKITGQWISLK